MLKIALLTLLWTLLLFSKETCIVNFNKEVCGDFELMPSVIVKTKLSKEELKQHIRKPLKQIAFLEKSNLFLVKSSNPLAYVKELSKKDFVIYAQPDILQQKEKHKRKVQDITAIYHLKDIWKENKGEGVNIAIIDDGFNLEHEDLKETKIVFQYDVEQQNLDASPKINLDKHGTQVAGVIFAAHNGKGIDGIAPKARLIAIRQVSNKTSETILAFTVANLAKADIINCSWKSPLLLEPLSDVIKDIIQRGREGKGVAIVFSAGNSAKKILPYSTEASIEEAVVVGATQGYSNYGESVDFILASGVRSTRKNGYGFFGGTSATAPIISGLIALEFSLNKNLTVHEVIKKLKEKI